MNYFIGKDGTVKYSQTLPTQKQFEASLKMAKKGDIIIMPDGTKIKKK